MLAATGRAHRPIGAKSHMGRLQMWNVCEQKVRNSAYAYRVRALGCDHDLLSLHPRAGHPRAEPEGEALLDVARVEAIRVLLEEYGAPPASKPRR